MGKLKVVAKKFMCTIYNNEENQMHIFMLHRKLAKNDTRLRSNAENKFFRREKNLIWTLALCNRGGGLLTEG